MFFAHRGPCTGPFLPGPQATLNCMDNVDRWDNVTVTLLETLWRHILL